MYFPIFIDLSKKKILIVGAGSIAARRVRVLTKFAGDLTIVAPKISAEIEQMSEPAGLHIVQRRFCEQDIEGCDLVLAATNDDVLNRQIHEVCYEKGIPVNVCSDQSLCDFFFPSVVTDGEIVVGINASGQNHSKVKLARKKIECTLGIGQKDSNYQK